MFLNAVLCFRLKLHLLCGSANLWPRKLHNTRINSVYQEAAILHHVVEYLFSMEKHSAIALSVTHLPVTDWHLVLRPPISRNGLKTGFVNFCTLKNQHKRNSVMIQWQRLVCHRLATFTNYITFLGWIFISET